ncbi:MAG: dodecin family protein [Desulfomonilia bacterium]|nr:dodecin family protein [Desulfomonilia bacterium]
MPESVYKVIEIIGSSPESWEKAAANAVKKVTETVEDLRIAEIVQLDIQIEENKIVAYRAKLNVSFRYHEEA